MRNLKTLVAVVGCLGLSVVSTAPAFAAQQKRASGQKAGGQKSGGQKAQPQTKQAKPQNRAGKPTAKSSSSVNRPNTSNNRSNQKSVSNQQAYKAGQASSNRNKKDVVVVNNPGHGGYYDNGRYYDNDRYDDDDNDFLEFVGKTAAITAGVSVVAAVIGSTTNEKPSDCQPVNANGQSYMYCNGAYYQQSGPTSQPTYTVVAPPQ